MKTGQVLILAGLYFSARQDSREKKINLLIPLLFSIALLISSLINERKIEVILMGCLGGIVVLILSWLSRGKIGLGDGTVLVMTGIGMGFYRNMALMLLASALMMIFALWGMAGGKICLRSKIAFVPFLLIAFVIMLALGGEWR